MFRLFIDIENAYGQEKGQKVRDVCTVVYNKVKNQNLFGWKWFIEEVISDLANYMLVDNFAHSQGGYVTCGMQAAIDHSRKCNTLKRRGDFELVSLDTFFQVEDDIPDESRDNEDFLFDLELAFGKEVRDELEPFVTGRVDKISKAIKDKLNTPEFRKFLEEYRAK